MSDEQLKHELDEALQVIRFYAAEIGYRGSIRFRTDDTGMMCDIYSDEGRMARNFLKRRIAANSEPRTA